MKTLNFILILGGRTEIEQQETKDKLVDGLNSVKNSLNGGIVAGGGATLVHASRILEFVEGPNQDISAGVAIAREACLEPIKILCENAGLDGDYIATRLADEIFEPTFGFNLISEEFEDLVEAGVIDSAENLKNILHDALSVGGMMLTSEAIVYCPNRYIPTELKDYKKEEI